MTNAFETDAGLGAADMADTPPNTATKAMSAPPMKDTTLAKGTLMNVTIAADLLAVAHEPPR